MKPLENKVAPDSSSLPQEVWKFHDQMQDICNFDLNVLEMILVKSFDGEDIESLIKIRLIFPDGQNSEHILPLLNIDKIDWCNVNNRCILDLQKRNAKKSIANMIRLNLQNVPTSIRYRPDKLGLTCINQTYLFIAGNKEIFQSSCNKPMPDIELDKLPFRLDIDLSLNPKKTFDGMRELISLSPDIGRVLVAHMISGITRVAFIEAGITPNTILMVTGKSGMLKSHYVPHMVQLYNRKDGIKATTRFNSSTRYIEDILYEYSECTAVIDDLHTAESNSIKKANENTAEEIIRRISDNTGRGHKEGNALVQKEFRGNAVFIGEYTIGRESTIPRFLVLNITKRPEGGILDEYQRHQPLVVSTFYYYYIQWYVDNYETIQNEIDVRLTKLRKSSGISNMHGRLQDTQFYLQTAYMFFLEFCYESGFLTDNDVKAEYDDFGLLLDKLIREQQSRLKPDESETGNMDYLYLIRKLYKNKIFRLADNIEQFNCNKHDGLIYYECLCLRGKMLDKRLKKEFPSFNHQEAVTALLDKNALKRCKNKNTVQISQLNGLRFYAIYLDKLK